MRETGKAADFQQLPEETGKAADFQRLTDETGKNNKLLNQGGTGGRFVRPMRPEDAREVAEIEALSISPPWKEGDFLDSLKQKDILFLVAEAADGKIAGYVCLYCAIDEGEITNVAVDPLCRRKGIARLLLEEAARQCRKKGLGRIVLEVRISNIPAIGLYETMGFTRLGIRKNFYEQPAEDALIMEWRVV